MSAHVRVCLVPDAVQNLAVSETEAWNITLEWQPPEPSDTVELYVVNVKNGADSCHTTLVLMVGSTWTDDKVLFQIFLYPSFFFLARLIVSTNFI